jgi:hypothetical protein
MEAACFMRVILSTQTVEFASCDLLSQARNDRDSLCSGHTMFPSLGHTDLPHLIDYRSTQRWMMIALHVQRSRLAPRLLERLCRGTIGNCMQLSISICGYACSPTAASLPHIACAEHLPCPRRARLDIRLPSWHTP